MKLKSIWRIMVLVAVCGLVAPAHVLAEDARTKATNAVTNILFDNNADDFVSYSIRENGFLDITFASNTPDPVYDKIITRLKNHPDIKGVLAGRDGPTCSSF